MKYTIFILLLGGTLGCSREDALEQAGQSQQALTGALSPQGFLTIKGQGVGLTSDEFEREQTTLSVDGLESYYYWLNDGSLPAVVISAPTLAAFRSSYGFGTGVTEAQAFYYNRGDLGLGREMHCVDTLSANGQAACYVTNFASKDADISTEYTFGFSSGFAFENMKFPGRAVATVAMVYQKRNSRRNKVLFIVYDGAGNLVNNAPLDRHGLQFQEAFALSVASSGYHAGVGPAAEFGVPGVNVNNHIPTNCLNCHGGQFYPQVLPGIAAHTTDASFLPWDLDQLEFEQAPGLTRADQEDQLRLLNQIARKVAFSQLQPLPQGGSQNQMGLSSPIVQQIDAWYNNTSHSETLTGTFHSTAASATGNGIIDGWNTATTMNDGSIASAAENRSLFYNVVRKCRGCHIASSIPSFQFNTPQSFLDAAPTVAADLKSHKMPHALQAQRDFWLSSQPGEIAAYFRNHGAGAAADILFTAGPDDIVFLDPPAIAAATL